MHKRTFLRTSSSLMLGSTLFSLPGLWQNDIGTNWSGNLHYSAKRLLEPTTVEEARDMILKSSRLRALGTRHCFNTIADCREEMISTSQLNHIVALDTEAQTVTVQAGMRYGELSQYLHAEGWALPNLASLPHISVAGACATATHGSGINNGNLATLVVALRILRADGEIINLSRARDGDLFAGTVVGLGSLGLVTELTLAIEPTFMVRQDIYEHVPLSEIEGHFDDVMSSGYSVSFFTDWSTDRINQIWIKSKVEEAGDAPADPTFYGGRLATRNMHPIAALSAVNCTDQMGVAGAWHERLPHFKLDFTPSSGAELQSEYFIDRKHAYEGLMAIQAMGKEITPHLFISEVRTIAADDLWMSTAYQRPSVAFHFTWKQDTAAVMALLPKIEAALAPYAVRPHWGKLFTIPGSTLATRYPRWEDFKALMLELDPEGRFRNKFIEDLFMT